jgi:dCTP deaminase
VLDSTEIGKLIKDQKLFIRPEPSISSDARSSGVDLKLGTWFGNMNYFKKGFLDVEEKDHESKLFKLHYVPLGGEYFIHPNTFVLCTTLEWIKLPNNITGYIIGKSSWGRRGLIIATASVVHVGFIGCLTLELANLGEIPIKIRPGCAICQLCLHYTTNSDQTYISKYIGRRKPFLGNVEPCEI